MGRKGAASSRPASVQPSQASSAEFFLGSPTGRWGAHKDAGAVPSPAQVLPPSGPAPTPRQLGKAPGLRPPTPGRRGASGCPGRPRLDTLAESTSFPGIGGAGLHLATGQLWHRVTERPRSRRGRRLGTRQDCPRPHGPRHLRGKESPAQKRRRRVLAPHWPETNHVHVSEPIPGRSPGSRLCAGAWRVPRDRWLGAATCGVGPETRCCRRHLLLGLGEMAWRCRTSSLHTAAGHPSKGVGRVRVTRSFPALQPRKLQPPRLRTRGARFRACVTGSELTMPCAARGQAGHQGCLPSPFMRSLQALYLDGVKIRPIRNLKGKSPPGSE